MCREPRCRFIGSNEVGRISRFMGSILDLRRARQAIYVADKIFCDDTIVELVDECRQISGQFEKSKCIAPGATPAINDEQAII